MHKKNSNNGRIMHTIKGPFGSRIRRGGKGRDFNGGRGGEIFKSKMSLVRKGMREILKLF